MLASLSHIPGSENIVGEIDLWGIRTGSLLQELTVKLPNKKICISIIFSMDGQSLYLNHQYTVSLSQPNAKILQLDTELQNQGIPVHRWVDN